MTTYASDVQRLSNWLKYEEEAGSGTTREVLAKSATNATLTGSVLDSTGQLVVAATLADATYILIDDLTRPAAAECSRDLLNRAASAEHAGDIGCARFVRRHDVRDGLVARFGIHQPLGFLVAIENGNQEDRFVAHAFLLRVFRLILHSFTI